MPTFLPYSAKFNIVPTTEGVYASTTEPNSPPFTGGCFTPSIRKKPFNLPAYMLSVFMSFLALGCIIGSLTTVYVNVDEIAFYNSQDGYFGSGLHFYPLWNLEKLNRVKITKTKEDQISVLLKNSIIKPLINTSQYINGTRVIRFNYTYNVNNLTLFRNYFKHNAVPLDNCDLLTYKTVRDHFYFRCSAWVDEMECEEQPIYCTLPSFTNLSNPECSADIIDIKILKTDYTDSINLCDAVHKITNSAAGRETSTASILDLDHEITNSTAGRETTTASILDLDHEITNSTAGHETSTASILDLDHEITNSTAFNGGITRREVLGGEDNEVFGSGERLPELDDAGEDY